MQEISILLILEQTHARHRVKQSKKIENVSSNGAAGILGECSGRTLLALS